MFAFVKRAMSCLFAGTLLLSACASRDPVIHNQPERVALKMMKTYHADTGFSPQEREDILRAAETINHQANGFVYINVVFDLNWETGTIEELDNMEKNANQILKVPHDASIVVSMDQRGAANTVTLGYCKVVWGQPWIPVKIYIIYDRLISRDSYVHVVMHEMLHGIQMHHISDEDAVMFWRTNQGDPSLCMNMADMSELCRAWGCNPTSLNFCD